jgi:hypothetical protein
MTNRELNFIYAGSSSEEHGVIACDIETIETESNDEESNIILSTTSSKPTWDFHGLIDFRILKRLLEHFWKMMKK